MQPILGVNPNKNIEDEYIHNLQQQMHFMELEIKLLKEKVIEDDEASGIGSLFNDEKYSEMRSDYLKRIEDMERERIKISEEAFILDAQINILTNVNTRMEEIRDKDEKDRLDKIAQLEKEYRELYMQRKNLDEELKRMHRDLDKHKKDNYDYNIQLKKEGAEDEHSAYRHERDIKAANDRHATGETELTNINKDLEDVSKQFQANPEYQANVESITKHIDDSKQMYVDLQLLKCQVEEMEQAKKLYEGIKDKETARKRKLIEKNKQLKKESETKEQTERMRMQKLMNDTKDPELRELMLNNAKVTESVGDLETGLDNEKEKYDKLLGERLVLDRLSELLNKDLEKHKAEITAQDTEIVALKGSTAELDKNVEDLTKQQLDAQVLNKEVEGKYRKLAKHNLALKAKLHFLLHSIDFKNNVKSLNLEDFRNLVNSNTQVNESIAGFLDKLTSTKDNLFKFENEVEAKGGTI